MKKKKLIQPSLETMDEVSHPIGVFFKDCKEYPEHVVERVGSEMVSWAINDDKALKLSQYATIAQISFETFYYFAKRNKYFASCFKEARRIIGDRREIGCITRKYDSYATMHQMVKYDDSYRKVEEWRSKLKKKEEELAAAQKIIVNLENFKPPDGQVLISKEELKLLKGK